MNGWTMANVPSPNVCEVANDLFSVPPSTSLPGVYERSQFPAKPASAGCLLAGAQTVEAYNNSVGSTVFVLYRFGVLLAANNLAAEYFPSLPLADAQDRALARSLAPAGARLSQRSRHVQLDRYKGSLRGTSGGTMRLDLARSTEMKLSIGLGQLCLTCQPADTGRASPLQTQSEAARRRRQIVGAWGVRPCV
jgi:hypothetical protein